MDTITSLDCYLIMQALSFLAQQEVTLDGRLEPKGRQHLHELRDLFFKLSQFTPEEEEIDNFVRQYTIEAT